MYAGEKSLEQQTPNNYGNSISDSFIPANNCLEADILNNSERMEINNPMFNEESKKKMVETKKKKYPNWGWFNKGRKRPDLTERNRKNKGINNPCFGKKLSKKHRDKISEGNKGRKRPHLTKLNKNRKGKKLSPEHKTKIIKYLKNNNPWNKPPIAKKMREKFSSKEHRLKLSISSEGKNKGSKNAMKRFELRKQSSIRQQEINGEDWKGFISFEPYDEKFNNKFKEEIRKRDNYICLNCGITEKEEKIKKNRKLSVHHVDYNKKNTTKKNCVTVCGLCNGKVNKNRDRNKLFFKKLLSKKYGYKYNRRRK